MGKPMPGMYIAALCTKRNFYQSSQERSTGSMDEAAFEKKLDDLVNEIGSMPSLLYSPLSFLAPFLTFPLAFVIGTTLERS